MKGGKGDREEGRKIRRNGRGGKGEVMNGGKEKERMRGRKENHEES